MTWRKSKVEELWRSEDGVWLIRGIDEGYRVYCFPVPGSEPVRYVEEPMMGLNAAKRLVKAVLKRWKTACLPEGLSPIMCDAILEFRELHLKDYGVQKEACGECYNASVAFLDFLRRKNVIKPDDDYGLQQIELSADDAKLPYRGFTHYVARIGKTCFDWTARQYCWSMVFPYIWESE